VWLPKGQTVRCNQWRKFDGFLAIKLKRYVREIILARREAQILGDDRPGDNENSTWYVMTPGLNYKDVGNYMAVGIGLNMA